MFCRNCGKEIKEDELFCSNCGQPVRRRGATASMAPQEMVSESTPVADYVEKSKKKWLIPVIVGGVLLVAGVAVFANFAVLKNAFKKTFSSPEKYYQYVEKENITEKVQDIFNNYGKIMEDAQKFDRLKTMDMTVSVSEEGRKTLQSFVPYDMDWLDSVHAQISVNLKDYIAGINANMELGQKKVVSLEMIENLENSEFFMRVPELSGKYLGVRIEDMMGYNSMDVSLTDLMDGSKEILANFPDKKLVEDVALSYMDIALSSFNNVDMKKEEVQVGDISHVYTKLMVNVDEETCKQMLESVLKQAQKDEKLKEMILSVMDINKEMLKLKYSVASYDYPIPSGEEFYEEFQDEIEYMLEELEYFQLDSNQKIAMNVWVDNKGKIIGREFKLRTEYGKESMGYKMVVDGKKFGYEAKVDDGYENFELYGQGTKSGNVLSGDFEVLRDKDSLVKVAVNQFNTADLKNGYLNGNFKISAGEALQREMMGNYGFSIWNRYSLGFNSSMKKNGTKARISLLRDEDEMLMVDLSLTDKEAEKIAAPSAKNVIYVEDEEDLLRWAANAEWRVILENLKNAGISSEIYDMLAEDLEYLKVNWK